MAYLPYKDNRPEELKQIEFDIRKTFQENLSNIGFPYIESEIHQEHYGMRTLGRKEVTFPKTILTVTIKVDVTDSRFTIKEVEPNAENG